MKRIITLLLIAAPLVSFSQSGFGFYPLSSIVEFRWNPQTVERDSSGNPHFATNYKAGFDVRSSFSFVHSGHGTNISAVPEVVFIHRIQGRDGEPMLLSGIGVSTIIHHNQVTGGSVFIPFSVYYRPQIHHSDHLFLNAESDAMLTFTSGRQTFFLRPLIGCGWIF